jgi:hypothetical protein
MNLARPRNSSFTMVSPDFRKKRRTGLLPSYAGLTAATRGANLDSTALGPSVEHFSDDAK